MIKIKIMNLLLVESAWIFINLPRKIIIKILKIIIELMFERTVLTKITPCLGRVTQKTAFFLFLFLDLLPNLFYCFYFILLTVIEIAMILKVGFVFTEERYNKTISIRIFFYFFSLLFAVFLFYYRNRNIDGFFTSIENYIIVVVEIVFILWNIYMSFSFKSSLKHTNIMEGFLGDEKDEFESYLPKKKAQS